MDFVVDHYLPIVNRLEDNFETLEQDIFRDEFDRAAIERLYQVKQPGAAAAQRGLPGGGHLQPADPAA